LHGQQIIPDSELDTLICNHAAEQLDLHIPAGSLLVNRAAALVPSMDNQPTYTAVVSVREVWSWPRSEESLVYRTALPTRPTMAFDSTLPLHFLAPNGTRYSWEPTAHLPWLNAESFTTRFDTDSDDPGGGMLVCEWDLYWYGSRYTLAHWDPDPILQRELQEGDNGAVLARSRGLPAPPAAMEGGERWQADQEETRQFEVLRMEAGSPGCAK